jgi:hypothetical protein
MKQKLRWANILCNRQLEPYLLIVTDGERKSQIPVTNCRLELVKRTARSVYEVSPKRIFVTQILDDIPFTDGGN